MAISKTQQFFEKLWYQNTVWWLWLFLPLNWLLVLLVWLRRAFYRWNIFKSSKPNIPVIVVGNINVGGTGKTPFSIFLLNWLKEQGYKPGLVTRGYGSDREGHPLTVNSNSSAQQVGDEPILIFKHTECPIVVDHKRSRGAQLLEQENNCNIVVCDDGLQHYPLKRDIEILIIDKTRQFGNRWLMPFGPLRETIARGNDCDLKVVNGDDMLLKPGAFKAVTTDKSITIKELPRPITAVAAIGNPKRFFDTLEILGLEFDAKIFPDHHKYCVSDFTAIKTSIMMTEKDAVKCKALADETYFYLPIEAKVSSAITEQLTKLLQNIKSKV